MEQWCNRRVTRQMKLRTNKRPCLGWLMLTLVGQFGLGCSGEEPGVSMSGLLPPDAMGTAPGVGTPPGVAPGNTTPIGTVPGVGTDGQVVPGAPPGTPVTPVTPPAGTETPVVPTAPAPDEPSAAFTRRLTHEEFDN